MAGEEDIEYDYGDDVEDTNILDSAGEGKRVKTEEPMIKRTETQTETQNVERNQITSRHNNDSRHHEQHPNNTYNRPDQMSQSRPYHQSTTTRGERRFFVLKCEFYYIIAQAKRTGVWPARESIAERLFNVSNRGHPVTLLFTLERAKCFLALADYIPRPLGPVRRFMDVNVKWLAVKDVNFDELPADLLPVDIFHDDAKATIRDGQELEYPVGKQIEKRFLSNK